MSLTLSEQPGFVEIPANTFDDGNPVTAETMKALNSNVNFAVVRTETFFGYYKHGETVQLPVSDADGYVYARDELRYMPSIYWTGAPPEGPLNGTETPPYRGATSGDGVLLQMGFQINQATGLVDCFVSYWKTSQMDTTDGILFVETIATRQR